MNLRVSYLVKANENFLSTHSIHINHHIFEKFLKMMSNELSSCYGHLSFHRSKPFFLLQKLVRIYIKIKQLIFADKGLNSPYQITVQDNDVLRRYKKFIVVGQLAYHNP